MAIRAWWRAVPVKAMHNRDQIVADWEAGETLLPTESLWSLTNVIGNDSMRYW